MYDMYEIFSLELLHYDDHLCKSQIFQMMLLTQFLLYGDQDLSYDLNKNILKLSLRFIHETDRFDQDLSSFSCHKATTMSVNVNVLFAL